MDLKKIVVILIVLALATMAQNCETGNDTTEENPFISGDQGLKISFEEDEPPAEVSDAGQWSFPITVKLQNMGEAYVEGRNVKVIIHGPNPSDFGVSPSALIRDGISEDINRQEKDSEGNTIEPEEVYVTFTGFRFQDTLTENFEFDIKADVCYQYSTRAVANGCVVTDPTRSKEQSYCVVDEQKPIFNSGAPIAITVFEEKPQGADKIKYVFTVQHKGSGRFFLPGTKCSADTGNEYKVHFAIDSRVADLDCRSISDGGKQGELYLGRDGEATVTCVQQVRSSTDYIDRIAVTLTYDYLEDQTTPIVVKASG